MSRFSYARLNELYRILETDTSEIANDRAYAYHQAIVNHVPRDTIEASEIFLVAIELVPEVAPIAKRVLHDGRSVDDLIELRRLLRLAVDREDECRPPLQYQKRVLTSLVTWMSTPVTRYAS